MTEASPTTRITVVETSSSHHDDNSRSTSPAGENDTTTNSTIIRNNNPSSAASSSSGGVRHYSYHPCQECQYQQAIYQCPKCSIRTCSLVCCQRHKQKFQCNGKRNRTTFQSISQMNDSTLMNDYFFLEDVLYSIQSSHRLIKHIGCSTSTTNNTYTSTSSMNSGTIHGMGRGGRGRTGGRGGRTPYDHPGEGRGRGRGGRGGGGQPSPSWTPRKRPYTPEEDTADHEDAIDDTTLSIGGSTTTTKNTSDLHPLLQQQASRLMMTATTRNNNHHDHHPSSIHLQQRHPKFRYFYQQATTYHGIQIHLMPYGMNRMKQNRSYVHPKNHHLFWTIEYIIHYDDYQQQKQHHHSDNHHTMDPTITVANVMMETSHSNTTTTMISSCSSSTTGINPQEPIMKTKEATQQYQQQESKSQSSTTTSSSSSSSSISSTSRRSGILAKVADDAVLWDILAPLLILKGQSDSKDITILQQDETKSKMIKTIESSSSIPDKDGWRLLLPVLPHPANQPLYRQIDYTATLKMILPGTVVIEFPTIHIVQTTSTTNANGISNIDHKRFPLLMQPVSPIAVESKPNEEL